MLFDVRTYRCKPGTIAKHLAIYKEYGWAPQTKHLGQPYGYFVTETGTVNTYLHIWAYKDAADRAARRAAMLADPDWQTFMAKSAEAGYLEHQENSLMTEAAFFTPRS